MEWCKIRVVHDGYEGYIETESCDFSPPTATHWVKTRATLIFEEPDIKTKVLQRVLFGSELSVTEAAVREEQANNAFLKLQGEGYVWADHCSKIGAALNSTMIDLAQNNYLQAPYLWGGRSSDGCDCSGLVQMLAMATGVSLPRDSGDQERALTLSMEYEQRAAEDLVYWPGHVGVLKSPELLLHSTAHSLQCCIEPLSDVELRAGSPTSVKRISHIGSD